MSKPVKKAIKGLRKSAGESSYLTLRFPADPNGFPVLGSTVTIKKGADLSWTGSFLCVTPIPGGGGDRAYWTQLTADPGNVVAAAAAAGQPAPFADPVTITITPPPGSGDQPTPSPGINIPYDDN